jgi:hypothetical protein
MTKLTYNGPMPDVYVDGRPDIAALEAAFRVAFDVPSLCVFDAEDGSRSYVDFLDRHTVAQFHRLDRATFATKLDIFLFAREDVRGRLSCLAAALGMAVVIDIGLDVRDESAVLFRPDGSVWEGWLTMVVAEDGCDGGDAHFVVNRQAQEVAEREAEKGGLRAVLEAARRWFLRHR